MCGIAGLWEIASNPESEAASLRTTVWMTDSLQHRGPDDSGIWSSGAGLVLGHRRLSIQDTSDNGRQPMHSSCGRYVVAYNGEIYNFQALRGELTQAGHSFRGHSDTEVLLAAVVQWGLEEALRKFNGPFAFGLWDEQTSTLHLARDRVGKKPLYFGWTKTGLVFASELKALRRHPSFEAKINQTAVALYLRHNYIPAPHSIYQGVSKLTPGGHLAITRTELEQRGDLGAKIQRFWDPLRAAQDCLNSPFEGSFESASSELEARLKESVASRMIADVPIGILLSGGIDSTLVTAVAQAGSARALNTFSIGFEGEANSEADAARRIAGYLGTSHNELILSGQAALDVIPSLHNVNDEPMGDPSQIPTCLVSKLAGSSVTVALTGDGGDELFYGYKRYFSSSRIWNSGRRFPAPVRSSLAFLAESAASFQRSESKLRSHANVLRAQHPLDVYTSRMAKYTSPQLLLQGSNDVDLSSPGRLRGLGLLDAESNMMLLDFTTYLVDYILVKVDRASMHHGLEIRNPLLDISIIEHAWRLPQAFKYDGRQGKRILRDLLGRYVPRELTDRPKQGFSPPLKTWLHGPLREWADSLLDPSRLDAEGIFHGKVVDAMWQKCKKDPRKSHSRIWTILMFQVWHEGNVEAAPMG